MATSATLNHLKKFFQGHTIEQVPKEKLGKFLPKNTNIISISPGPRSRFWTYFSSGASTIKAENQSEFFLISLSEDLRTAELVSLVTHYHSQNLLDLNHTFAIGEAWKAGSLCSSFLVAAPECYSSELARYEDKKEIVQILWLIPITEAERNFAVRKGLSDLEEKMEQADLKYWDPFRSCVVTGQSPLDA